MTNYKRFLCGILTGWLLCATPAAAFTEEAEPLPVENESLEGEMHTLPMIPSQPDGESLLSLYLTEEQRQEMYSLDRVLNGEKGYTLDFFSAEEKYPEAPVYWEAVQTEETLEEDAKSYGVPLRADVYSSEAALVDGTYSGSLTVKVQNSSAEPIQANLLFAFYDTGGKMVDIRTLPETEFFAGTGNVTLEDFSVSGLDDGSYLKVFALDGQNAPLCESVKVPLKPIHFPTVCIDHTQNTGPLLDGGTHQMMELDAYFSLIGAMYLYDEETSSIIFQRNNLFAAMTLGSTEFLLQRPGGTDIQTFSLAHPPIVYQEYIFIPYDEISETLGMKVVDEYINGRHTVNIYTSDLVKGSEPVTIRLNAATHLRPTVTGCVNNGIAYFTLGQSTVYLFNGSAKASIKVQGVPETMLVDKETLYYAANKTIYRTDLNSASTEAIYTAGEDIWMLSLYNGDLFFKEGGSKNGSGTMRRLNPVKGTCGDLGLVYAYDIADDKLYATTGATWENLSVCSLDLFTGDAWRKNFTHSSPIIEGPVYFFSAAYPCEIRKSDSKLNVRLYCEYWRTSSTFGNGNGYVTCFIDDGSDHTTPATYEEYDAVQADSYRTSSAKRSYEIDFRSETKVKTPEDSTSMVYTDLLLLDRESDKEITLLQGSATRSVGMNGYWHYNIYGYGHICGCDAFEVFFRVAEQFTRPGESGSTTFTACTRNPNNSNLAMLETRRIDY